MNDRSSSENRSVERRDAPRRDLGIGGQRHEDGSSRDPARQAERTKEEKHG